MSPPHWSVTPYPSDLSLTCHPQMCHPPWMSPLLTCQLPHPHPVHGDSKGLRPCGQRSSCCVFRAVRNLVALCLWENVFCRATKGFWFEKALCCGGWIPIISVACVVAMLCPFWTDHPVSPANTPQLRPAVPNLNSECQPSSSLLGVDLCTEWAEALGCVSNGLYEQNITSAFLADDDLPQPRLFSTGMVRTTNFVLEKLLCSLILKTRNLRSFAQGLWPRQNAVQPAPSCQLAARPTIVDPKKRAT